MKEDDILEIIAGDATMMRVLQEARACNLTDWAIGAGFVRNKVWAWLSGDTREGVETRDIDLVYFDTQNANEEKDQADSLSLKEKTGFEWEVVNEVYAHAWNSFPPYTSTKDAISKWPETVTAIGVSLDEHGTLSLIAPYGIEDLVNFVVRPTPIFLKKTDIIRARVAKKGWQERWPQITFAF
jgi:hypothetical protein